MTKLNDLMDDYLEGRPHLLTIQDFARFMSRDLPHFYINMDNLKMTPRTAKEWVDTFVQWSEIDKDVGI
mgnify:CR=1 FL=1